MNTTAKNITKALVFGTACTISYKIGQKMEDDLNKKENVSETDRAATLVAVSSVGFGIGLVARAICKKIG